MALIVQVCGADVVVFDDSTPEDSSCIEIPAEVVVHGLTQFKLKDLLKAVKTYKETL